MSELEFPTYEKIGLRPLINCRGTYTIVSGCVMLPEVRAALVEVPDGEYFGEDAVDDDGISDTPLHVKAKVTVKGENIEVDFDGGDPVSIDGKKLSPAALLTKLNELGGAHGIGRLDLVENRYVGMKSRGVYETPGGTVLFHARRAVESLTLDKGAMHLKDELMPRYAEVVYNGFWFAPERRMLQAAIDESQVQVNGRARVKLYKGDCAVVGRKSDDSLYREELATYGENDTFDHEAAIGFIKLHGLSQQTQARLQLGASGPAPVLPQPKSDDPE